jgi:circadian clock protein KaiC
MTGLLTAYDTTAFLLGEYREEDISRNAEFAAADGVVELSRRSLGARDERYFRVFKLRGSSYLEGVHAVRITAAGLKVFPRLISPAIPKDYGVSLERVATGIGGLDKMLHGGYWRGSSTLLAGPSGAGKTTVALQFVLEGARLGEPGLYVSFQENPTQLARTVQNLVPDPKVLQSGNVEFMYSSPVELQIDTLLVEMFHRIENKGVRRVVIDSVGDLSNSAPDPQRLHDYLYALIQHFAVSGVSSILTVETASPGLKGHVLERGSLVSLVDNFVVLDMEGDEITRRTLRVVKTRGSPHDPHVREIEITSDGVRLN